MRVFAAFVLGLLLGAFAIWFFVPLPPPQLVTASARPCPPQPATAPAPEHDDVGSATIVPPSAPEHDDAGSRSAPEQPATTPTVAAPPDGSLAIPVEGVTADQLIDTYSQARGAGRSHDAIDIMAAAGTRVFAVDDGRIVKLFNSKPGGLTVYEFDESSTRAYYYAHLSAYAPGLTEGQVVKRGDLIGFVGSTGNAIPSAPHLHFAVFMLGPEKRWWEGTAINPYPLLGGK